MLLKGNEESCKHQSERSYDDRFQPCMLMGAGMAATAIKDSLVTYHGPGGCRMSLEHLRSDNIPNGLFNMILYSGDDQSDVIFGGEAKLKRMLEETVPRMAFKHRAKLIWLLTACGASIIGDDIHGIAQEAEKKTGLKIIPVDTPGFAGGYSQGMQKVYTALLDRFVSSDQDCHRTEGVVNIVGPHLLGSKNWPWDYPEMIRMMNGAGITTNIVLTHKTDVNELNAKFMQAEANYILTSEELPDFEGKCQDLGIENWGNDLVLPIGIANTEEWMVAMATRFGNLKMARTQLEQDMKVLHDRTFMDYNSSWLLHDINGKHVAIYGNANWAAAMARFFLYDLNAKPVVIGLLGESTRAIEYAKKQLADVESSFHPQILKNPTFFEWGNALRDSDVDFSVGMKQDKVLTEGLGIPHISLGGFYFLNQWNMVPWPYFGIRGVLGLLSEIAKAVADVKNEKDSWKKLSYIKGGRG